MPAGDRREQSGRRISRAVADFRLYLAHADALVGLCLIAALAGLLTGVVIVAFRMLTESGLVWAGVIPEIEAYEALSPAWRLALPTAGGLVIGVLFQVVPVAARSVGPAHVMAQLANNGGRLPWSNAVLQFAGGAVSIISGHSVGREGPVIHVGAASASLLGQWMRLPNNSIRTLVACGVAASIAASFNTPLAGVVFAMEVVMFEYTLAGFAPVILAAVCATSVSRLAFGPDPAFAVPHLQLVSLLELPWVLMLGLAVGCLAAAYIAGIVRVERLSRRAPPWLRMTLAGAFTGVCALAAPEVMGLGYDTVQLAMVGGIGLLSLVLIALLKLLATVACGGLGVPGGMIGPMVVIGATAGGALGIVGDALVPATGAAPAFYAMLGVAAMMGASLHAPLAALTAILELTANPNTLLPGMAAVIGAFLMSRVVFRQEPLFVSILQARGIEFRFDPVALALERTGVAAAMSRDFVVVDVKAGAPAAARELAGRKAAAVLVDGDEIVGLRDGERFAQAMMAAPADAQVSGALDDASHAFATVPLHATLGEALGLLDAAGADAAVVCAASAPRRRQLHGVITRQQIDRRVRYRAPRRPG